jgi:hypothetical protein
VLIRTTVCLTDRRFTLDFRRMKQHSLGVVNRSILIKSGWSEEDPDREGQTIAFGGSILIC